MRGKVGQNCSYLKSYSGRVLIDALHQAEVPTQVGADLRVTIFVGSSQGDTSYNGVYTLTAAEPFDVKITGGSPAKVTAPNQIALAAGPGQTPQLHLLFPGRTVLPNGLRIIRPGYTVAQADAQTFTTEYVDLLARMNAGCLRSMDWKRTNGSEVTTWDSRCKPTDTLWGEKGKGGPVEPLIGLCNTLNADLWENIPAKADDNYVRQDATLIRDTLGPSQKVYVEYGNELWNNATDSFKVAYDYVAAQGAAVGLSGRQFAGKRAAEVGAIFADVFKSQPWRVVPVLAGATNDSGVLGTALAYLSGKPNPFKALAVAGYFNAPRTAKTPDEVFAGLAGNARGLWAGVQMQKFDAQVRSGPYLKTIYEWTASIETGSETIPAMVNNDQRIGDAIAAWGEGAFGTGVDVGMHFVPLADFGKTGWAATNAVEKWTPKCEALAQLSAAHPHPQAEDPRDARIRDLAQQLAATQAERDAAKAQAAAAGAERDRRLNQVERIKAVANE